MLQDEDFVDFGTNEPATERPTHAWYAQAASVFSGALALGLGFVAFAVTGGIGANFGIGQADARQTSHIARPVSYQGEQPTNSYWLDSMLHNVAARSGQAPPQEMAELDQPYQDISGVPAEPLEGEPTADDTQITIMGFSGEDQESGFDGSQGPFADPEAIPAEGQKAPPPEPAPAYIASM